MIIEVHREGKTVFFSSHIVPDIEEICDRCIFLKEGKLVYDGSVDQLLNTGHQKDYVLKFKSDRNLIFATPFKSHHSFPDHLQAVTLSEKSKSEFIRELVAKDIEITGLEQIKPSLEEIFYKTKNV